MAQGNFTNRRGHRRSLFREEMITEGFKLGALGLTIPEIAKFWNIGARTLARWIQNKPEFANEISRGKMEADLSVIQTMLDQARKGNMTAAIFWLKNRCGWKDNPVIDQSVHTNIFHNIKGMIEDTISKNSEALEKNEHSSR